MGARQTKKAPLCFTLQTRSVTPIYIVLRLGRLWNMALWAVMDGWLEWIPLDRLLWLLKRGANNDDNDDNVEDLLHLSRTPAPRAAESWGEPPAQPGNSLIEDKKFSSPSPPPNFRPQLHKLQFLDFKPKPCHYLKSTSLLCITHICEWRIMCSIDYVFQHKF